MGKGLPTHDTMLFPSFNAASVDSPTRVKGRPRSFVFLVRRSNVTLDLTHLGKDKRVTRRYGMGVGKDACKMPHGDIVDKVLDVLD